MADQNKSWGGEGNSSSIRFVCNEQIRKSVDGGPRRKLRFGIAYFI